MLQKRILDTLKFFGLQSTPLTLMELQKFLMADKAFVLKYLDASGELKSGFEKAELPKDDETPTLFAIRKSLAELQGHGKVVEKYGHYALSENEKHLEAHWLGNLHATKRERIIFKFIKGLAFIPFVRGVALAGSQALGLPKPESDIDLFIITKTNWVWLPRTLVTAYFHILGVRRYKDKISNRFCLNHYVTEEKQMLTGRTWYTAMEYGKLRPLIYPQSVNAFKRANATWMRFLFPNFIFQKKEAFQGKFLQKVLEKVLDNAFGRKIELWLGKWQIKRIRLSDPHTKASSDELFFSPHSKEDKVVPAFMGD